MKEVGRLVGKGDGKGRMTQGCKREEEGVKIERVKRERKGSKGEGRVKNRVMK